MQCPAIFRVAVAAVMLCAAIAVADVPAAALPVGYVTTTTPSSPPPSPPTNNPKIDLVLAGETGSEPDCEGDTGICDIVITIEPRTPRIVTVYFGTVDDTARAGEHYFGVTRASLSIPAGGTTARGKVMIRADRVMAQPKYFYVRIFEPSSGEIRTSQRRMMIPSP